MILYYLFGSGRAQAYTVHEGPTPPQDRIDRAEALRFVRDGFSFSAALTAPFWLAAHKLWLALAGYVAAVVLIVLGEMLFDWHEAVPLLLMAAIHLIVGFEADSIERAALEQQGWQTIGSATGATALECERRFFDHWLTSQPVLATRAAMAAANTPPAAVVAPASARVAQATLAPGGDQTVAGRLAALWGRRK